MICPRCGTESSQHSESAYIEMGDVLSDFDDDMICGDINFEDWADTFKCKNCKTLFWVERKEECSNNSMT